MQHFMQIAFSFCKSRLAGFVMLLLVALLPTIAHALSVSDIIKKHRDTNPKETFEVQFKDVTAQELVHFVSKITDINFVYNKEDLQFKVTFAYDHPTSLFNILSAFIQILKIHDVDMIEDGQSLVLYKNSTLKEMSPVSKSNDNMNTVPSPLIVTHVFSLQNVNPELMQQAIRPFLSSTATVVVVAESRQLIISDSASNIQKVKELLDILEKQQSPMQVVSYRAMSTDVTSLSSLLNKLIMPLTDGNPIIVVPQPESGTLFVVSTPNITHQALIILRELDNATKHAPTSTLKPDNILVYHLKFRPEAKVRKDLQELIKNAKEQGFVTAKLASSISASRYIASTHSLVFLGDSETLKRIKSFLTSIDVSKAGSVENAKYEIYQPKNTSATRLLDNVKKIASQLTESHLADHQFLNAIHSIKVTPGGQTLTFVGDQKTITEVLDLLKRIDVKNAESHDQFFVYTPIHFSPDSLLKSIHDLASKLQRAHVADPQLIETIKTSKIMAKSHSILFTGNAKTIQRIKTMVADLDKVDKRLASSENTLMYHLKQISKKQADKALEGYAESLPLDSLVHESIENRRWIPSANAYVFHGSEKNLKDIQDILALADTNALANDHFFTYHIQKNNYERVKDNLKEYASGLDHNDPLYKAVSSAKWLSSSHMVVFKGSQTVISRIEQILKNADTQRKIAENHYSVYTLQHSSGIEVKKSLQKVLEKLKEDKIANAGLIQTLNHIEWVNNKKAVFLSGSQEDISQAEKIIQQFDNIRSNHIQEVIHLQSVDGNIMINELSKLIKSMPNETQRNRLLPVVESIKWVKASNSLFVSGSKDNVDQIHALVTKLDQSLSTLNATNNRSKFFIYQPKHLSAPLLLESIGKFRERLQHSGLADPDLLEALCSAKYVETTHTILFTGTSASIKRIEELMKTIDVAANQAPTGANSEYLMYKPKHMTAKEMLEHIQHVLSDLKKSKLSDRNFIRCLESVRIVESTKTLLFTGNPDTLKKANALAEKIDDDHMGTKIKQVGLSTFLIYRVKSHDVEHILQSLKQVSYDLKRQPGGDKSLIKVIDSAKYVADTHSLIFTGPQTALNKIRDVVSNLDNSLVGEGLIKHDRMSAEGYQLYRPRHVDGAELIHLVKDFESNLRGSGVNEPHLYDVIQNLKWMPKTHSILISGDKTSTEKVIKLLERFDNEEHYASPSKGHENIETIDNMSFLVYKVQYHDAKEIISAIQGVGADLLKVAKKQSKSLDEAIKSLQFIKATNSLIATSDPKTLTRLKELIMSIDVPLKQVFIEVLVLETELDNRIEIGLRWGGQGVYKDRFAFSGASFPVSRDDAGINFQNNISDVNATTPPEGTQMPIPNGGSLGVIGDFIFHKGKTYFALGDFLNAIQVDSTTTIVLNQKLIAQDNQTANFFVGQNIPYNGSVVQTSSDAQTIASNIEYRDIGVKLQLTPHVGENGVVTMDVQQSITEDLSSGSEQSSNQINVVTGIKSSKTTLDTKVHVPNNNIVAIGGQIRTNTLRTKSAIPCLGGLPLIGAAFSETRDTKAASNVILFIKPTIVNTYEQYRKTSKAQEELFRDQTTSEDFDRGLELIKTPDSDD